MNDLNILQSELSSCFNCYILPSFTWILIMLERPGDLIPVQPNATSIPWTRRRSQVSVFAIENVYLSNVFLDFELSPPWSRDFQHPRVRHQCWGHLCSRYLLQPWQDFRTWTKLKVVNYFLVFNFIFLICLGLVITLPVARSTPPPRRPGQRPWSSPGFCCTLTITSTLARYCWESL